MQHTVKDESGFTPVRRTEKKPGDWEYVWQNGKRVPVRVADRQAQVGASQ